MLRCAARLGLAPVAAAAVSLVPNATAANGKAGEPRTIRHFVRAEHHAPLARGLVQCETKSGFEDHDVVMDMFALTSLVYKYGEDSDFKMLKSETVKTFLDRVHHMGDAADVIGIEHAHDVAMGQRLLAREPDLQVIDFVDLRESSHLQAAVTLSKGQRRIVVTFRGSETGMEREYMDWVHNAMTRKVEIYDGIWAHKGFNRQLDSAYQRLLEVVKEAKKANPSYSVYVTGHSLGGALSTLFGFRASMDEPSLSLSIVSFAAPRVGNEAFKEAFNARPNLKHTRIANKGDIVTSIPVFRYQHCGNNIKLLDNKAEFYSIGGHSYNTYWEYSLFNNLSIAAHGCDKYFKKLVEFRW